MMGTKDGYFDLFGDNLIHGIVSTVLITLTCWTLFVDNLQGIYSIIFSLVIIAQIWLAARFKSLHENVIKKLQDSEKEKHHMTYYDEITKLPNERYLLKKIKENLTSNTSEKAVLVLEIERLSTIKSSLGSFYTDRMLQMVAERLQKNLPNDYLIGKLREDQFLLLLENENDHSRIEKLCRKLQDLMKSPFLIQHFSINVNINIGIAFYPEDAGSAEDLIHFAQFAMDEARKIPEHFAYYRPSMSQERADKITLENDLYTAIQDNQLVLHYQPQLELKTNEMISMEALVRWKHPEKGWITPLEFIPIAEESGLIVPIGKWVLETACRQTKELQELIGQPVRVAVNLSIRQLFHENFVQVVRDILKETELPPEYLQLEITESMTMDTSYMMPILNELKETGVTIAMDDFGKGYSSLSYLKDLPIDCLKIDREFVRNIEQTNSEPIVDLIISMSKHLNLKVVAEGVETMEQLDYLLNSECDTIQGYLISKPIPFCNIAKNLKRLREERKNLQFRTHANYYGLIKEVFN
ncbi:bifunctional diguanylate cyclase/phosphodiesterase [Ureibacillus composti]|nr:bifunctional diguanylate cyclase/phosphodiesterase [Ureibacillus composti]